MGLNEFAGYVAVAASAYGDRLYRRARTDCGPQPFYLGRRFRRARVSRSRRWPCARRGTTSARVEAPWLSDRRRARSRQREVFWRTTLTDRNLSSRVSQAGLVNNLNDGMAWGVFPLCFAAGGHDASSRLACSPRLYPATWGVRAALHRRVVGSRRAQAADRRGHVGAGGGRSLVILLRGFDGLVAHRRGRCSASAPRWFIRRCWPRSATSLSPRGGRRRWACTGFGATSGMPSARLLAGITADALGLGSVIAATAVLTFASGALVAARMRETLRANP